MTEPELVTVDLTDEERELMVLALNEYAGTAQHTYRVTCPVFGLSDHDEWAKVVTRLKSAVDSREPLSGLDWARDVSHRYFLWEHSGRVGVASWTGRR